MGGLLLLYPHYFFFGTGKFWSASECPLVLFRSLEDEDGIYCSTVPVQADAPVQEGNGMQWVCIRLFVHLGLVGEAQLVASIDGRS